MNHLRLAGVFSVVCALGLSGMALTPALAGANGRTATAAHAKKHHKRHKKHKKYHPKSASGTPNAPVPAQSAVADYYASGIHVQFHASRKANGAENSATGYFIATLGSPSSPLMQVQGPVTCLEIEGNDMGLFYPVTSSVPAAEGEAFKGIYISAHLDSSGKPESMGFMPTTSNSASACDPFPGMFPISSGTLTLTS